MRPLLYNFFKALVRSGLFCYYQEIQMHGLDRVPGDRAVMLLPNHQNALLDPLLYAAFARVSKPYFLTRSDVFSNPLLKWMFEGLRMMPIYRLRDGRETLSRNQQVFETCATLFSKGAHILLFPEASHNLKRQVRPLSKGFTRILAHSFEKFPQLDIWIVPVGVNYQKAADFPDRVAFYFGEAFSTRVYWGGPEQGMDIASLRERVFQDLTKLTTHVPPDADYMECVRQLEQGGVDLLNPDATHRFLSGEAESKKIPSYARSFPWRIWDLLFHTLNAPVWIPWRWIARNKVWEPEFMSTFRFIYALLAMPLYYLMAGVLLSIWLEGGWPVGIVFLLFLHNLVYVKLRPIKKGL